jgi:hypothetical protein
MDGLVIVSVELVEVATAVCALFWQLNNNAIQQVKEASFIIFIFKIITNVCLIYEKIR